MPNLIVVMTHVFFNNNVHAVSRSPLYPCMSRLPTFCLISRHCLLRGGNQRRGACNQSDKTKILILTKIIILVSWNLVEIESNLRLQSDGIAVALKRH